MATDLFPLDNVSIEYAAFLCFPGACKYTLDKEFIKQLELILLLNILR